MKYENLTFNAFRYEILMAVCFLVVHNKDFFTYCMMGLPEFKLHVSTNQIVDCILTPAIARKLIAPTRDEPITGPRNSLDKTEEKYVSWKGIEANTLPWQHMTVPNQRLHCHDYITVFKTLYRRTSIKNGAHSCIYKVLV